MLAAIAAGFAAYLAWSRQKDGADDRLIGILKGTVEELEKKVNKQDEDIKGLVLRVAELKTTNETLTRILQGRDEATIEFQRNVMAAVSTARDTHDLAINMEKSLNKLTDLISAHIVAIETSKGPKI